MFLVAEFWNSSRIAGVERLVFCMARRKRINAAMSAVINGAPPGAMGTAWLVFGMVVASAAGAVVAGGWGNPSATNCSAINTESSDSRAAVAGGADVADGVAGAGASDTRAAPSGHAPASITPAVVGALGSNADVATCTSALAMGGNVLGAATGATPGVARAMAGATTGVASVSGCGADMGAAASADGVDAGNTGVATGAVAGAGAAETPDVAASAVGISTAAIAGSIVSSTCVALASPAAGRKAPPWGSQVGTATGNASPAPESDVMCEAVGPTPGVTRASVAGTGLVVAGTGDGGEVAMEGAAAGVGVAAAGTVPGTGFAVGGSVVACVAAIGGARSSVGTVALGVEGAAAGGGVVASCVRGGSSGARSREGLLAAVMARSRQSKLWAEARDQAESLCEDRALDRTGVATGTGVGGASSPSLSRSMQVMTLAMLRASASSAEDVAELSLIGKHDFQVVAGASAVSSFTLSRSCSTARLFAGGSASVPLLSSVSPLQSMSTSCWASVGSPSPLVGPGAGLLPSLLSPRSNAASAESGGIGGIAFAAVAGMAEETLWL